MNDKRRLATTRARALRKNETEAERLLWAELRGRRHDGLKFRRQHPVAPYIIDFAERSIKLAIEIDGATHSTDAEKTHDAIRTEFLTRKGWTVLRFTNNDVFEDTDETFDAIWREATQMKRIKDAQK